LKQNNKNLNNYIILMKRKKKRFKQIKTRRYQFGAIVKN